MNMFAWCGGGVPPEEPPDLVAESAAREEQGRRTVFDLWPPRLPEPE